MSSSDTSVTLLEGLCDPRNESAWRRFDARYRSLLVSFGRKLGLNAHDAEEAAQTTVAAFCMAYLDGKYERGKGRLKNWLLGIAEHKITDLLAGKARRPGSSGERGDSKDILAVLRDRSSLSAVWEQQWQAQVIRECFERANRNFSTRDMQIFETLTVGEQSVEQVGKAMNMSPEAVRQVRHRVLSYMRSTRKQEGEGDW